MSAASPRAHRDPLVVETKRAQLDDSHIAPLTDFVKRHSAPNREIPWFDPDGAGVNAKILFLLENPGPKASIGKGSGFISIDNDDGTVENFFTLSSEAGLRRDQFASWNIVPWYQAKSETSTANASAADVREASPLLRELIGTLMPELRIVVTMGSRACDGWLRVLVEDESIPLLPTIALPHCSPRNLNTRGSAERALILNGMRRAAVFVGDVG